MGDMPWQRPGNRAAILRVQKNLWETRMAIPIFTLRCQAVDELTGESLGGSAATACNVPSDFIKPC
jgi:hypothetical protein